MKASVFGTIFRSATVAGIVLAGAVCAGHSAKAYTYKLDDGTAEDALGLTSGGTVIALNHFTTTAGNTTIGSISAAFGAPGGTSSASLVGESFTVLLYSDPNGDGNPSDAALLASAVGTLTSIDSNTFITIPITATALPGTSFFVGYSVANTAGTYPAALDETTDAGQSFVVGDTGSDPVDLTNLNDNDIPPTALDDIGFGGNWLVRANTAVPEPSTYAMMGVGAIALGATLRLRRQHTA